MNYWYSARHNEIFLDLDSTRAAARALSVLRCAIMKGDLRVYKIWLFPTRERGHAHLIISLVNDMDLRLKTAWALWMGSDRLRGSYSLARDFHGLPHTDLLVSTRVYHRVYDAVCHCEGKHKEKKVTEHCEAMAHLLSDHCDADYFTRTGHWPTKRKRVRFPWGQITKKQLIAWKEGK